MKPETKALLFAWVVASNLVGWGLTLLLWLVNDPHSDGQPMVLTVSLGTLGLMSLSAWLVLWLGAQVRTAKRVPALEGMLERSMRLSSFRTAGLVALTDRMGNRNSVRTIGEARKELEFILRESNVPDLGESDLLVWWHTTLNRNALDRKLTTRAQHEKVQEKNA